MKLSNLHRFSVGNSHCGEKFVCDCNNRREREPSAMAVSLIRTCVFANVGISWFRSVLAVPRAPWSANSIRCEMSRKAMPTPPPANPGSAGPLFSGRVRGNGRPSIKFSGMSGLKSTLLGWTFMRPSYRECIVATRGCPHASRGPFGPDLTCLSIPLRHGLHLERPRRA